MLISFVHRHRRSSAAARLSAKSKFNNNLPIARNYSQAGILCRVFSPDILAGHPRRTPKPGVYAGCPHRVSTPGVHTGQPRREPWSHIHVGRQSRSPSLNTITCTLATHPRCEPWSRTHAGCQSRSPSLNTITCTLATHPRCEPWSRTHAGPSAHYVTGSYSALSAPVTRVDERDGSVLRRYRRGHNE